jgi:hypothetical protein
VVVLELHGWSSSSLNSRLADTFHWCARRLNHKRTWFCEDKPELQKYFFLSKVPVLHIFGWVLQPVLRAALNLASCSSSSVVQGNTSSVNNSIYPQVARQQLAATRSSLLRSVTPVIVKTLCEDSVNVITKLGGIIRAILVRRIKMFRGVPGRVRNFKQLR